MCKPTTNTPLVQPLPLTPSTHTRARTPSPRGENKKTSIILQRFVEVTLQPPHALETRSGPWWEYWWAPVFRAWRRPCAPQGGVNLMILVYQPHAMNSAAAHCSSPGRCMRRFSVAYSNAFIYIIHIPVCVRNIHIGWEYWEVYGQQRVRYRL
jgi:hypothetical protein